MSQPGFSSEETKLASAISVSSKMVNISSELFSITTNAHPCGSITATVLTTKVLTPHVQGVSPTYVKCLQLESCSVKGVRITSRPVN